MNKNMIHLTVVVAILAIWQFPAFGTTYTFDTTDGVWNTPGNWNPNGTPQAGDTAVIPSGKTCRVEDDDQEAEVIQVSGTLGIVGKTLVIGKNDNPTTSTCDSGAVIYMEKVSTVTGTLAVRDWATISGSGTISAKADDSREGIIVRRWEDVCDQERDPPCLLTQVGDGLILSPQMTMEGTIKVLASLELKKNSGNGNQAVAEVNDADDVMILGNSAGYEDPLMMKGEGKFLVTAGKLEVKDVEFADPTPTWELTGGEIQVFDLVSPNFTGTKIIVVVTGGTLNIDENFETSQGITWSGGTIRVAEGVTEAKFN